MASKPSKSLIAKALWKNNEWVAQFALPGHVPDLIHVEGQPHRTATFQTEQAAENAAIRAAFAALNASLKYTRKPGNYELISPETFATLLDEADLGARHFAELLGVPESRVIKWLNGEADVPHWAHLLIRLMSVEDNYRDAKSLMAQHLKEGGRND